MQYSPDGKRIALSFPSNIVKICDTQLGQCKTTLRGHNGKVYSLSYSPDGQTIATGSNDDTAKIWDPETGQCKMTLKGHMSYIDSLAFSPDGQTIATGSGDNTVKTWDPETGQCKMTLDGHNSAINSVNFSPDGQTIVGASGDNTVKIWDAGTGELKKTVRGHQSAIKSLAFSPDGTMVATGSNDNTVMIWDPVSWKLKAVLIGHMEPVHCLAFSPDLRYLLSTSYHNITMVWDMAYLLERGENPRIIKIYGSPLLIVTSLNMYAAEGISLNNKMLLTQKMATETKINPQKTKLVQYMKQNFPNIQGSQGNIKFKINLDYEELIDILKVKADIKWKAKKAKWKIEIWKRDKFIYDIQIPFYNINVFSILKEKISSKVKIDLENSITKMN